MGKIKLWYRSIPIWMAFFLFAAGALVAASYVSNQVTKAAYSTLNEIQVRYFVFSDEPTEEKDAIVYHWTPFDGSGDPTDTIYVTWKLDSDAMSPGDLRMYRLCWFAAQYIPFFVYSACLLAAALLFYFSKMKKPLRLLQAASGKIAENELDFSLDYSGHDEMAKLCKTFEKMRTALDENNLRMLRMVDEQHQLNDAYTHDLRTPIAILRGYTDMLARYYPAGKLPREEVIETIDTMSAHVARLEQFVKGMNTAQKLADVRTQREAVPAADFICQLRETAAILCEGRDLSCRVEDRTDAAVLNIDISVVTQVFENLLGNAIRFAKSEIFVRVGREKDMLSLCVADDGRGFTEKELLTAAKPYYSGKQEGEGFHFGLGLHICRTLCEKHGGSLRLANRAAGGAEVTAFFSAEAS